jgi:hypothetical protein
MQAVEEAVLDPGEQLLLSSSRQMEERKRRHRRDTSRAGQKGKRRCRMYAASEKLMKSESSV